MSTGLAASVLWMALVSPRGPAAPPSSLADIASLEAFKARFNADLGTARLILLLSPT